ncbi:MAG: hypothetical protein C5B52_11015 [Bacteroidetes bacterium]|nr:MAG: hypothetical protein C5B52_11015 [Bacteroidota bacterium]
MESNSTNFKTASRMYKKFSLLSLAISIVVSGFCFYLSEGLSGNFWYLLWIAPIPILIISYYSSWKTTALVAFLAYLIGRLSWLPYLLTVVPGMLAILFTLLLPLIFAVIVLLNRFVIRARINLVSIFAYPVFFCLFEWIGFLVSRDGTIASLAYSQANFLPLIQIASIAGILAISFWVCLFASTISMLWIFKKENKSITIPTIIGCSLILLPLLFGIVRISKSVEGKRIKVGLAVVPARSYKSFLDPNMDFEKKITQMHIKEIDSLAKSGVEIVVLAEKVIPVTDSSEPVIMEMLKDAARRNGVTIVVGITRIKTGYNRNIALVIDKNGRILEDYEKVNLFPGEMYEGFRKGKDPGLFDWNSNPAGVAICKDLDFDRYIARYNEKSPQILFVPAWDFDRDGWLHSRMAILRSVENGYPMVRVAQQGRLTLNDNRGRVYAEATTNGNQSTTLSGNIVLKNENTLYRSLGYYFGELIAVCAILFLFSGIVTKPTKNNPA